MWSEDKARIAAAHGRESCLDAVRRGDLGNTMSSWPAREWLRIYRRGRRKNTDVFGFRRDHGIRVSHPAINYWVPNILPYEVRRILLMLCEGEYVVREPK